MWPFLSIVLVLYSFVIDADKLCEIKDKNGYEIYFGDIEDGCTEVKGLILISKILPQPMLEIKVIC